MSLYLRWHDALWHAYGDQPPSDPGLATWQTATRAWPWLDWPRNGRVLEIGCADTSWLEQAQRVDPGLLLTGIDWRPTTHEAATVIQGDVLAHDRVAARAPFDAVVMLSTLEHIGLGRYNNDPRNEAGDTKTLERCARWARPGGWVYADVPYVPSGYRVWSENKCRCYDANALVNRLTVPGLRWAGMVWASRAGVEIEPPGADRTRDGLPYVYVACLWRRE